jgi:LysM repeat protein
MEQTVKKMVLVGLLAGLGLVVGCDSNKKPQTDSRPVMADPAPAAPQPYIPPTASNSVTVTPAPTTVTPAITDATPVTPAPTAPKGSHHKSAVSSEGSDVVGSTYVVKSGDSLSKIAKKVYGSASKKNIDRIKKANGLKSDVVRVGQKLKIPGGSVSSSSSGSSKKHHSSGNKD